MAEFTKGQWEFVKDEFNCESDKHCDMPGSIKAFESPDDYGWFICRIDNAPSYKANAQLIAASPLLYQALRDVLSDLEQHAIPNDLSFIREALLKADKQEV